VYFIQKGLPDEDVTAIEEIPVYSINRPKPESLVVLKILEREEGRPKMMKKGRLLQELEEADIIAIAIEVLKHLEAMDEKMVKTEFSQLSNACVDIRTAIDN
jgi:hypothetical protein